MKIKIRIGGYAIHNLVQGFELGTYLLIFNYFNYCIRHKRSTFRMHLRNTCNACENEMFHDFLKEAFK